MMTFAKVIPTNIESTRSLFRADHFKVVDNQNTRTHPYKRNKEPYEKSEVKTGNLKCFYLQDIENHLCKCILPVCG